MTSIDFTKHYNSEVFGGENVFLKDGDHLELLYYKKRVLTRCREVEVNFLCLPESIRKDFVPIIM